MPPHQLWVGELRVLACIRQTIGDPRLYVIEWQRYGSDPRMKERSVTDRPPEALGPVIQGRMPVVIPWITRTDIVRALEFAESPMLKPIISGATQGWKASRLLTSKQVPFIVSVKHPARDPKGDSDKDIPQRERRENKKKLCVPSASA